MKSRIIIVDKDTEYVKTLQIQLLRQFWEGIDLEIITDEEYFNISFSSPQKADILVISEEMYDTTIKRHSIGNIYVLTEKNDLGETQDLSVQTVYRYSTLSDIISIVCENLERTLFSYDEKKRNTQVIVVTSASGGAGKTTISMGVCRCLKEKAKRILYINASRLQSFSHMFNNNKTILQNEVYERLLDTDENIYSSLIAVIEHEEFDYLPSFKGSIMSVGLDFSIFENIIISAKKSLDYDYIIVDTESAFDEYKTRLLDVANKVIIVTENTIPSISATNLFVNNISGISSDKYFFVCNKSSTNELVDNEIANYDITEYIGDYMVEFDVIKQKMLEDSSIKRISMLIM